MITKAFEFADKAHAGQFRKYTKQPYIVHPRAVAGTMVAVSAPTHVVAAAVLHDVVEDCGVTLPQIAAEFGEETAALVNEVTKRENKDGSNRAARKARDRAWYAGASFWGKSIKLADMLDNLPSIVEYDPDFGKVYVAESRALYEVLLDGHPTLVTDAGAMLAKYEAQLAQ